MNESKFEDFDTQEKNGAHDVTILFGNMNFRIDL